MWTIEYQRIVTIKIYSIGGTIVAPRVRGKKKMISFDGKQILSTKNSGLYGEFAKAIGRNIGGHWVPKEKSLANSFNKHGYNKKAAKTGEGIADGLSIAGSTASAINGMATEGVDGFLSSDKLLTEEGLARINQIHWVPRYFTFSTFQIGKTLFEGEIWGRTSGDSWSSGGFLSDPR